MMPSRAANRGRRCPLAAGWLALPDNLQKITLKRERFLPLLLAIGVLMSEIAPLLVPRVDDRARQSHSRAASACKQLLAAIETSGGDANTWHDLATSLLRIGEHQQAMRAFARCLELDEHHSSVRYELGRLLCARGATLEGLKLLTEHLKRVPDHRGAQRLILRQAHRFQADQAPSLHESADARIVRALSSALCAAGEPELALSIVRTSSPELDKDHQILRLRFFLSATLGEKELARQACRRCIGAMDFKFSDFVAALCVQKRRLQQLGRISVADSEITLSESFFAALEQAYLELPQILNQPDAFDRIYDNDETRSQYENRTGLQNARFVADEMPLSEGQRVLDVGCGHGLLIDVLLERHTLDAYAFDQSPRAVEIVCQRHPQVTGTVGDIVEMAYPDNHFDAIACMEVLEHVSDPEGLFDRLIAMVRPGGYLALTVPDGRLNSYMGHINFWSPESFKRFASRHPLESFKLNPPLLFALLRKPGQ
jgi:predicted TPR repeat methyltransferase